MKKIKGQSTVEFALMAPFVFLLVFATFYGGMMFMDYLNLSNEARTVVRQISVADEGTRDKLLNKYRKSESTLACYVVNFVPEVVTDDDGNENARVKVTFKRDVKKTAWPSILVRFNFPPQTIKPIVYTMRIENAGTSTD